MESAHVCTEVCLGGMVISLNFIEGFMFVCSIPLLVATSLTNQTMAQLKAPRQQKNTLQT